MYKHSSGWFRKLLKLFTGSESLHEHEYVLEKEVHYWYIIGNCRWYEFTYEVYKCKHCDSVLKKKVKNALLPVGGENRRLN